LSGPTLQGQALQRDEVAVLPLATENGKLALSGLSEVVRGDDARVREELVRSVRKTFKQLLGTRPTVIPLVIRI
jgi:ribonuclease J